jgi:tetratricopeptide (TPR) repeat protein
LTGVREAISEYLQSLAIQPNNFEANLNLATAYLQVDEPQLGLPYAKKAARLKPDSQPARVNLGSIYAALGQYNDAIDEFRAAAELGDLETEIALNLANAFIRTNRPMRALNTLLVLSRGKGAGNAMVQERLGYTYFKLKEYDKSLQHYDKALAIDPNDSASLNGKGVNLMTMYLRGQREDSGLRDRAIEAWQKSVRIKPNQRKIIDLIARYRKL